VLPAALVWAERGFEPFGRLGRTTPPTSSASRPVSAGEGSGLTRQVRSRFPRLRR
jgi:hypothetical protein